MAWLAAAPAAWAGPQPYHASLSSLPDQPGVLSAEALRAARAAAAPQLSAAPQLKFELIASGVVEYGGGLPAERYAVFATAWTSVNDRVQVRTLYPCFSAGSWFCRMVPPEVRVQSGDAVDAFPFDDPLVAAEIAGFARSPCLGLPRGERIVAVGRPDRDHFDVHSGPPGGGGNYHLLARADSPAGACKFRVVATGTMMTHAQAQASRGAEEQARAAEEARKRGEDAARSAEHERDQRERKRFIPALLAIGRFGQFLGLVALIAPWLALAKGRWAAATTAFGLTGASVAVSFTAYSFTGEEANELVFSFLLVWPVCILMCIGLLIWAAVGKPKA